MKTYFLLSFLLFSVITEAQEVRVLNFYELQEQINSTNSGVKVINFWATYCKPCVHELALFDSLQAKYNKEDLQVLLVSLDFPEQLESKVKPFMIRRGMNSEVVLLDDMDANSWINKVDPSWSGAIPATLIISGKKRKFIEGEVSKEMLRAEVEKILVL